MASTRVYEDLCEILKHELDGIARKGEIDKESLDDVHKLTSSLTMVKSLMKQDKEKSNGDYSNQQGPIWNRDMSANSYANEHLNSNMMGNPSYDGNNAYMGDMSNARRGRDGDGDGRYSEDSYRRGRDARTGRYVSRDSYERGGSYERGYSRHTARERMIVKLEEMADNATNENDKQTIMRCVEQLEN